MTPARSPLASALLLLAAGAGRGVGARDPPIVLFLGPTTTGVIGDRTATTAACVAAASSRGLDCGASFMLLSYDTGDDIPNACVPEGSTCFSTTAAIVADSLTGTQIAPDWAGLFSAGALTNPFNVIAGVGNEYWTGMTTTGLPQTGATCAGWTYDGNTLFGIAGLKNDASSGYWVAGVSEFCSTSISTVCVCVPSTPLLAETASPTAGPSAPPTRARAPIKSAAASPAVAVVAVVVAVAVAVLVA